MVLVFGDRGRESRERDYLENKKKKHDSSPTSQLRSQIFIFGRMLRVLRQAQIARLAPRLMSRADSSLAPAATSNTAANAVAVVKDAPKSEKPKVSNETVSDGGSTFGQRLASFLVGCGVGFG